jgi:hypothetical protein
MFPALFSVNQTAFREESNVIPAGLAVLVGIEDS